MFRSNIVFAVLVPMLLTISYAQRRPLSKPNFRIRTGQVDNIGRIDYDPKTGNYIFQWKGMDRKMKEAVYVPRWKAILTIIATVQSQPNGFRYTYVLINAPKSPQAINGFGLVISEELKQVRVSLGWRFRGIVKTTIGKLADFFYEELPLKPGSSLRIEFLSPYPPSIIKCYASGDVPIMRVPEEMPGELEDRLPRGIEETELRGWTVGPVAKVSFSRLLSDWQVAIKEGWVKDEKVAGRVAQDLRQILLMVNQKRYEQVQRKAKALIQFTKQNQKLLEPEAQALVFFTLPYLINRLQVR